jgi:hypothetical protein
VEVAPFPRNKSRAAALEDWQTRTSRGSLPRCVSGIRRMLDLATMPGLLIIGRPKSMMGVDYWREWRLWVMGRRAGNARLCPALNPGCANLD